MTATAHYVSDHKRNQHAERRGRNAIKQLSHDHRIGVAGRREHRAADRQRNNKVIFFLTAALAVPTLVALLRIRPVDIDPDLARGGIRSAESRVPSAFRSLLQNRALLIFICAVLPFQFANAASTSPSQGRAWSRALRQG